MWWTISLGFLLLTVALVIFLERKGWRRTAEWLEAIAVAIWPF